MEPHKDTHIPRSIGIIMDGNRRWAREKHLPTLEGHMAGYKKLHELMEWADEFGVAHVTVYALSTENWNRSKEEVAYLMDLFRLIITEEVGALNEKGVRVIFAGDLTLFPKDIQSMMYDSMENAKENTRRTLTVAASYGGRRELAHAFNKMQQAGIANCTEEDIEKHLWTAGTPDPDLIIRTGGEQRLSNFLTWQSVYSELMFTKTYWPDFGKEEFSAMLEEYAARERRHGK